MTARILIGDMRKRLGELPDGSVDSCVTDPPYHLTSIVKRFGSATASPAKAGKTGAFARASKGFMGQTWDGGDVAFDPETWAEVWRVLKPGAHLVAFSGTRTYHRMACAIEDAGFEIRDQLAWCYGSGFPKSLDVSKQIDKAAGAQRKVISTRSARVNFDPEGQAGGGWSAGEVSETEPATDAARQWQGWGTALKPAWEPICLARKPLIGTVAGNVMEHGTGALNIDGCRIEAASRPNVVKTGARNTSDWPGGGGESGFTQGTTDQGRWPANILHDGSDEVLAAFPDAPGALRATGPEFDRNASVYGKFTGVTAAEPRGDSGSAARFFYCAKTSAEERGEGNNHPTVKPADLMRWLVVLTTPPGGTVLDPFMGSGSTLIAADQAGFNAIGCELSPDYAAIAEARIRKSAGMFAQVEVSPSDG